MSEAYDGQTDINTLKYNILTSVQRHVHQGISGVVYVASFLKEEFSTLTSDNIHEVLADLVLDGEISIDRVGTIKINSLSKKPETGIPNRERAEDFINCLFDDIQKLEPDFVENAISNNGFNTEEDYHLWNILKYKYQTLLTREFDRVSKD